MENSENLTPWQTGQSGNPAGKPKGALNRSTILKRYLATEMKYAPTDIPVELDGKITVEEAIVLALVKKAIAGDISAIKEIQDTVYGKNTDKIESNVNYTQMGRVIVGRNSLEFNVGSPSNNGKRV